MICKAAKLCYSYVLTSHYYDLSSLYIHNIVPLTQNTVTVSTTPLKDDGSYYPSNDYDSCDANDDDVDLLLAAEKGRLNAIQSILEEGRCNVNDEDEVCIAVIVLRTLL